MKYYYVGCAVPPCEQACGIDLSTDELFTEAINKGFPARRPGAARCAQPDQCCGGLDDIDSARLAFSDLTADRITGLTSMRQ